MVFLECNSGRWQQDHQVLQLLGEEDLSYPFESDIFLSIGFQKLWIKSDE